MNYTKRGVQLSNEEFDKKIADSPFKRVGQYINTGTSIELECKKCGKHYKQKPKEFKRLSCRICQRKKSYIEYLNELDITILEKHYNMKSKLKHKCLKCDEVFINSPRNIKRLTNNPCPNCSTFRMNLEEYKERLPIDIECLSDTFLGTQRKILHRCLTCKHEWDIKPGRILYNKTGCPICKSSKGERNINNLLISHGIEYIREYGIHVNGNSYRFDFYLPKENILIEYDGIQHFETNEYFGGDEGFEIIKQSDNIKNQYCIDNNIDLIRINYKDDYDSILSKMSHILSEYDKVDNIVFNKIEQNINKPKPKKPKEVKLISLEDILGNPSRLNERYIKRHRPDIHKEVLNHIDLDISFKEKLWYYSNNITKEHLCICGNKTTFNKKFSNGYKKYCSSKCAQSDSETKNKRKKTVLEKYGVTNVAKNSDIRKKTVKTNIERYGHKSTFQNEGVRKKWSKNIKEKYDVDHIFQLDSVKSKIKDTMDEKYGQHYTKTEDYKKKSIITNNSRYGKDWYTQTKEYKEIVKSTNIENFGVEHYFNSEDYRKKMDIILETLDVEYLSQTEEVKNKIMKTKRNKSSKLYSKEFDIEYIENKDGYVKYKSQCGHITNISVSGFFKRRVSGVELCTTCNPFYEYKAEREIKDFLINLDIKFKQNKYILPKLQLDFYLPDYKLGIEHNGLYWHSELNKDKTYHKDKTDTYNKTGIDIIHIWEDDWIYKKDIIKSNIINIINKVSSIDAKECIIKDVNITECDKFLNTNHILGSDKSTIRYGLYYKDNLVSIMTFINNNGKYELSRFCDILGTNIINGSKKLFEYFLVNYNERVYSISENTVLNYRLFKELGFVNTEHSLNPWIVVNGIREHKELVKRNEYRVWGCGYIRWEYNPILL